MQHYIEIVNPEKCSKCFNCVKACDPKAIKITANEVTMNDNLCINCGFCLKVCKQNIFQPIHKSHEIIKELEQKKELYAVIDEYYLTEYPNLHLSQLIKALKYIGFKDIIDNTLAVSIYMYLTEKYKKERKDKMIVQSFCMPFVRYAQKYHHDSLEYFLPYYFPEILSGKMLKAKNPKAKVVSINTCFSDVNIINSKFKEKTIDYILSIKELKLLFEHFNVNPYNFPKEEYTVYYYNFEENIEFEVLSSSQDCINFLKMIDKGKIINKVIIPYWCDGTCYGSFALDNKLSVIERKYLIEDYMHNEYNIKYLSSKDIEEYIKQNKFLKDEEIKLRFYPKENKKIEFSKEEIIKVLKQMDKNEESKEYDCSACGYANCKEHAKAILSGMSNINNCIPYVINENKRKEQKLKKYITELDDAFALTIPNSKLEIKLKTTPEYKDEYDKETGKVKILGIIEDGGYRHVVNALKVAADLKNKGIMNLIGIEKDVLVQVIIFHDIGKTQPKLQPGDIINPTEWFEDGKKHAERSAEFAKNLYHIDEKVYLLIKYHHHNEQELPEDFPKYLLPMYRLFRIIDGMSAGLTRRDSIIDFKLEGSCLYIKEDSKHPKYKAHYIIDLYKPEYEKKILKFE